MSKGKIPGLLSGLWIFLSIHVYSDQAMQEPVDANPGRISVSFFNVSLHSALQVLADELGYNLIVSGVPDQLVSLHVDDIPVIEALDMLLIASQLDRRQTGSLLTVAPASALQSQSELLRHWRESAAELESAYLQINYAAAEDLLALVTVEGSTGPPERSLLSDRGSITVDVRTNTLVLRDTAERVARIRELIAVLDRPVRQVLIEAKVVSASEETGRELGARWGALLGSPPGSADSEFGLRSAARDYWLDLVASNRNPTLAALGLSSRSVLLELELSALQSAGQAELIARPRVTTQDNMTAIIQSGVRIPYQAQAGGTAGGSITQFVDAVLSLEVTPLITPDGRIIMRLDIRQDSVASGSGDVPAINTNTVSTSVLVDDGHTLVLGGIFRDEQTHAESGTPLLMDMPLVGGLFRRQMNAHRRTELLIFITPQIVPAP
jgi:type IV pilus assembly protein PilQ